MFQKKMKALQSRIIYGDYYSEYQCQMEEILRELKKKRAIMAIWGYGLKGEAFLKKNDPNGDYIKYVIDMKETLHGEKATTGQLIISYEDIIKYHIDTVLVMNKVFYNDIERTIQPLNATVQLIDVDILIENKVPVEKAFTKDLGKYTSQFPFDMKELQQKVLEVMLEIDRICKKNKITYFLSAGTALGAVRHKGFIPWDEDMDIGMLREDYEKFRQVVEKELDSRFYYQTIRKGSEYCFPFDQVGLKNTAYVTETYVKANMNHGLHVDIFPFDQVSENEQERISQVEKFHHYRDLLRKKMLRKAYSSRNPIKQFIVDYEYYKLKLIPTMWLKKKIESVLQMYDNQDTKFIADICTHYKKIMYFDKKKIIPTKVGEFETYYFAIPADSDVYLTMMYGDYMTPPAEEKRMQKFRIIYVSTEESYIPNRSRKG